MTVLWISSSAVVWAGESEPCGSFLNRILPQIVAPSKPFLTVNFTKLKTEKGFFTDFLGSTFEVERILPDAETSLGRYAKRMETKNTIVFFDQRLITKPVFGYSVPSGRYQSPVRVSAIALNKGYLNNPVLQNTIMHESFHNLGARMNQSGKKFIYNSEMRSRGDLILIDQNIYAKYVNSEEVHTFTKNFIHDSIRAHHRQTLQLIEKRISEMPANMSRSEKLQEIHLSFDSVIDPMQYRMMGASSFVILKEHHGKLMRIEKDLQSYLDAILNKKASTLRIAEDADGKVNFVTDEIEFLAKNYRMKDFSGARDPELVKKILSEVQELADQELRIVQDMGAVHAVIENAGQKGFFTAEEYVKLKNAMSKVSKNLTRIQDEK